MYLVSSRATDFSLTMVIFMRLAILVALSTPIVLGKDEPEKDKEVGTVIGIDLGTTYSWYCF